MDGIIGRRCVNCCRRRATRKMQSAAAGSSVYGTSTTDRGPNFSVQGRVNCAAASNHGHLPDPDRTGYNPHRPDCAGNGSDVTTSSSRGRRSPSSSSSGQSADDVNACPRTEVSVDGTSSYADRGTAADFNVAASELTVAHNGYCVIYPGVIRPHRGV